MSIESKAIKAIKIVRIKEREAWRQAVFCKERNMKLEEIFNRELQKELGSVARELEDLFDTGYISVPYD
jgi:hypothetical protein